MTYQEKLAAMWAQADAQTADRRNRGKFLVMAKTSLPSQARVSGSDAGKTRGLNDEDGHPFLSVVEEGMQADHVQLGWEVATRPAAVPKGVEFTLTAKMVPPEGIVGAPVGQPPFGGILGLSDALEHGGEAEEAQADIDTEADTDTEADAQEQPAAQEPASPKGPGRPKAKQDGKN